MMIKKYIVRNISQSFMVKIFILMLLVIVVKDLKAGEELPDENNQNIAADALVISEENYLKLFTSEHSVDAIKYVADPKRAEYVKIYRCKIKIDEQATGGTCNLLVPDFIVGLNAVNNKREVKSTYFNMKQLNQLLAGVEQAKGLMTSRNEWLLNLYSWPFTMPVESMLASKLIMKIAADLSVSSTMLSYASKKIVYRLAGIGVGLNVNTAMSGFIFGSLDQLTTKDKMLFDDCKGVSLADSKNDCGSSGYSVQLIVPGSEAEYIAGINKLVKVLKNTNADSSFPIQRTLNVSQSVRNSQNVYYDFSFKNNNEVAFDSLDFVF